MRRIAILLIALLLPTLDAEARGRCDGIHRCRCGSTQTAYYNLPRNYNGYNLWQAVDWVKAFPHTTARSGVVGYQRTGGRTGHVFRVASVISDCKVMATDEKGTYERDICRHRTTFVDPTGMGSTSLSAKGKKNGHRSKSRGQPVPTFQHTFPPL